MENKRLKSFERFVTRRLSAERINISDINKAQKSLGKCVMGKLLQQAHIKMLNL